MLLVLLSTSIASSALTGCAGKPATLPAVQVSYPRVDAPPARLLSSCPRLKELAKRKFTVAEAEAAWNADSNQYKLCAQSKDALVAWYLNRDARLKGQRIQKRVSPSASRKRFYVAAYRTNHTGARQKKRRVAAR